MTQHDDDLATPREKGFSNVPKATRDRLMNHTPPERLANALAADTTQKYAKNDLVGLGGDTYRGHTFRVEKVNPTTYLLAPLDGGHKVRAPSTSW
jgi:hypothetical protein